MTTPPSLDVIFRQEEASAHALKNKTVVLIDVLRVTSTLTTALAAGAAEIRCYRTVREVFAARRAMPGRDVLLCGERNGSRVRGFDLGNSPRDFTPTRCRGRTLLVSSTNGTRALRLTHGASNIILASFLNLSAVAAALQTMEKDIVFLCAGTEGHRSTDDIACAGAVMDAMSMRPFQRTPNAVTAVRIWRKARRSLKRFLLDSEGGEPLKRVGLERDAADCARKNRYAIVPTITDRKDGWLVGML